MKLLLSVAVTLALIFGLGTQVVLQAGAVTPVWNRTLSRAVPALLVLFAVVVWSRLSPYL